MHPKLHRGIVRQLARGVEEEVAAACDVPEPRSRPRRRLRDCERAMVYLALTEVRLVSLERPRGRGGRCHSAPSSYWCIRGRYTTAPKTFAQRLHVLLDRRDAALLDHRDTQHPRPLELVALHSDARPSE